MAHPLKSRIDIAQRILSLPPERAQRGARILSATLYLLLALIAVMEIANPGAVQRISSQGAGRILLAVVAGLLLLVAAIAASGVFARRSSTLLQSGLGDAILHLALAIGGLDLAFGNRLISAPAGGVLVAILGLLLLVAGVLVAALAWRPIRMDGDSDWRARELRAIRRRDHWVRGAIFTMLGGFLLEAGMHASFTTDRVLAHAPWRLPLLAAAAVALSAYGLHSLWLMRQEERLWLA